MSLFDLDIDRSSWERVFQSVDAFEPLIKAIFDKHGLAYSKAENLTPGTNAVFKAGDKVIKIYAPEESGFYEIDYFEIDKAAQSHINNCGITTPKVLFSGVITDKYVFRYVVMEFISGQETQQKLESFSEKQKRGFAHRIKDITSKINVRIDSAVIPVLPQDGCLTNENPVFVHGDLTAENVIIDDRGGICLLDFEDSLIAPYFYEWPPLVFDLFRLDPVMMEAYFGDYKNDAFYERLTQSVLIHEYGNLYVKEMCEARAVDSKGLESFSQLKEFLIGCLS